MADQNGYIDLIMFATSPIKYSTLSFDVIYLNPETGV